MEASELQPDTTRVHVVLAWLSDIQQSGGGTSTLPKRKASNPSPCIASGRPCTRACIKRARRSVPCSDKMPRATRRTGRGAEAERGIVQDSSDIRPTPDVSSSTPSSSYSTVLRSLSSNPIPTLPSQASSTRQSSPKRRPRSPTKLVRTPADLHLAQIPIRPVTLQTLEQIPPTLRPLFDAMKRVMRGHGTIPKAVASEVSAALRPRDPELEDTYLVDEKHYPVEQRGVLFEFEQIKQVVALSEECNLDGAPEVVWNECVHSRLLEIALTPYRGALRHRNVTTVDICPEYLLPVGDAPTSITSTSGSATGTSPGPASMLQTKRVDYVIALDDENVRAAAERLVREEAVNGASVTSVNHVDSAFLRCRPIAISIETKTPDGGELHGRTQLSIWGAAHMMRLRALAEMDKAEALALPLVLVIGSRWTVYFLVDHGDSMHMIEALTLDDSSSIIGCYRVIALIRELGRWSSDIFHPWWESAILGKAGVS